MTNREKYIINMFWVRLNFIRKLQSQKTIDI